MVSKTTLMTTKLVLDRKEFKNIELNDFLFNWDVCI